MLKHLLKAALCFAAYLVFGWVLHESGRDFVLMGFGMSILWFIGSVRRERAEKRRAQTAPSA